MPINYSKYLNYIAVGYALVLPLSRAGVTIFTALLILLWLLEGNLKQKLYILKKNKVVLSIVAFLTFNFISLLWTNSPLEALNYIRTYWYVLPIFVLYTSLDKAYIPKVLSAFISGMLISEIISYGVFFEVWLFKHATIENPTPFMHHIEYSVFLAFTTLTLLSKIFNTPSIKLKLFYAIFFTTMSGNLFLTEGRTGQISFILGLFVLALVSFKNKVKALAIAVILSVTLLTVAFNISTTFKNRIEIAKSNIENIITKEDYCTSLGGRVGAYISAKDIVLESPMLGVGIIDNMDEFRRLVDEKYPKMGCIKSLPHMHNQYVQILTQLGFIGLGLFLWIFYNIAKISLHKGEFYYIKYSYLTVLLFALIPEVLLHRAFSLTLFALIIGLLLAKQRSEDA